MVIWTVLWGQINLIFGTIECFESHLDAIGCGRGITRRGRSITGGLCGGGDLGSVLGAGLTTTGLSGGGLLGSVLAAEGEELLDEEILEGLVGRVLGLCDCLQGVDSILDLLLLEQSFDVLGGEVGKHVLDEGGFDGERSFGGLGGHDVLPFSFRFGGFVEPFYIVSFSMLRRYAKNLDLATIFRNIFRKILIGNVFLQTIHLYPNLKQVSII